MARFPFLGGFCDKPSTQDLVPVVQDLVSLVSTCFELSRAKISKNEINEYLQTFDEIIFGHYKLEFSHQGLQ